MPISFCLFIICKRPSTSEISRVLIYSDFVSYQIYCNLLEYRIFYLVICQLITKNQKHIFKTIHYWQQKMIDLSPRYLTKLSNQPYWATQYSHLKWHNKPHKMAQPTPVMVQKPATCRGTNNL